MTYKLLPIRHANARYQAELLKLAVRELTIMLSSIGLSPCVSTDKTAGAELIAFECDASEESLARLISNHSLLYLLFREGPEGALYPVCGEAEPLVGGDLAYIQKYKGKTNERFSQLLINMAAYSSAYAREPKIRFLDPMCARGTSLFLALNRGWEAFGLDADKREIEECEKFFKRYLEYHRIKHSLRRHSMTVNGRGAPVSAFALTSAGREFAMSLGVCDVMQARAFGTFHAACADFPYGVQHAPSKGATLGDMAREAARGMFKALLPGGAAAVSFNENTLSTSDVRSAFADAGFRVLTGGPYDGLSHWVEQAVTRDIVVALKPEQASE